jgi:putative two-component system response regulator
VLTGDHSPESKRRALQLGARDFLNKPFDATEAMLRIRNLLETKFLYRTLEEQNQNLERRVQERTSELQQSQNETLERLARTSEIRDDETGRHTHRVGVLSGSIARSLGFNDQFVELILRAAPLHDVGKIGIPDAILLKPGSLTDAETQVMRSHTVIGARVLSGGKSDVMQMAEKIALSHHERWDGNGYPHGLFGTEIPIEARIVTVADCVDALTHNRPYRMSWPLVQALEEIERCSGSHFDPDVVAALMSSDCRRRIVASPPQPWPAVKEEGSARRFTPIR